MRLHVLRKPTWIGDDLVFFSVLGGSLYLHFFLLVSKQTSLERPPRQKNATHNQSIFTWRYEPPLMQVHLPIPSAGFTFF